MTENNHFDINNRILPLSKQELALYIVATPIGNMDDITIRAIKTLSSVDIVACEDTRVTGKLLSHLGIKTKTTCYNDHSTSKDRDKIISMLESGQSVALVSDAGTPLISDPGYKLVKEAAKRQIKIVSIPGASSVPAALSICGLPTDRFLFEGFLPSKQESRKNALLNLKDVKATLVFFESAKRLIFTLKNIEETLKEREISVARELTKKFEEIKTGKADELISYYKSNPPRGEIVLMVAPPLENSTSEEELDQQLTAALSKMSVKDAVALVSDNTGLNKKDVYKRALELKN